MADITPRHYRRVEAYSDSKANPTLALLRAIAFALDTDVPMLTGEPTSEEIGKVEMYVHNLDADT